MNITIPFLIPGNCKILGILGKDSFHELVISEITVFPSNTTSKPVFVDTDLAVTLKGNDWTFHILGNIEQDIVHDTMDICEKERYPQAFWTGFDVLERDAY